MVRPALDLALAVARAGAAEEPPAPPPRSLRPILGFNRLPASARQIVLRTLDEDAAFRARVAAAAAGQEASLGRAAWLFLVRPDGWESEVEQLQAAAAEASSAGADARQERVAQRRLRGAEEAVQRAEEQLVQVRAELASANTALAAERQARRQAEAERDALQRRVASLERERDAAHRRAAAATNEARRVTKELREQQAMLVDRQNQATAGEAPADAAPATAEDGPAPSDWAAPGVNLDQVRVAVEEAAAAAERLGSALGAAAGALRPPVLGKESPAPSAPTPADRRTAGASRRPGRRLPVALPPGVLEASREAAEFLVRSPGMLVVVDGYNATLRRWPDHPITEQRQRLVQALAGLSARSGCEVHVVFDGSGDLATGSSVPRGGVRVTFSAAGVEADELILDLVDQAPANRPVAVATDDRRVRREAAARGANNMSQDQLFAVAALGA